MLAFGDKIGEILHNISTNKLRVLLTGFSVSWGIFMLILLLGAGYGLENGVSKSFSKDAVNSMWIHAGQTSLPFKGLHQGRRVQFRNQDTIDLKTHMDKVDLLSGRFYLRGNSIIRYANRAGNFNVLGVHPDYQGIENTHILTGRHLNIRDQKEVRKTAVIGKTVRTELYGNKPAIGHYIHINNLAFLVVGVFDDPGDDRQEETIYIPISTIQKVFSGNDRVHNIALTIQAADVSASLAAEQDLVNRLADSHDFDAADERAVFVHNTFKEYAKYMSLFKNIRIFIWVIGIGSIIAGIVGISNIMLITVKERTREIGIRKTLGATPASIIEMILTEAILTTLFFGYIGLVAGIILLEVASRKLINVEYFHNPEVNLWVAFGAMGLLVICGALAGLFPARKASMIRPIEALRNE